MIRHCTAVEPRCRFQEENSEDYGSPMVGVADIANLIKRRTESHLQEIQAAVSHKPIVIRVECARWSNLTIIDTPGLPSKDIEPDDNIRKKFREIVESLVSPPHRLVLYLKSYMSKCHPTLQKIDPSFSRTVIVIPKFDDKLETFENRSDIDTFFRNASMMLGFTIHPFFVAVPKHPGPGLEDSGMLSNQEFRRQTRDVDTGVLNCLRLSWGFNEEIYGSHIGLSCLKKHLESEIHKTYKEAAPATLALLQRRCAEISTKLTRLETKLKAMSDVSELRGSAIIYAHSFYTHLNALLGGSGVGGPAPQTWGKTTREEHIGCGFRNWPGINAFVEPESSTIRLYGAAAFDRLMDEIHHAEGLMVHPRLQESEVATIVNGLDVQPRRIVLNEAAAVVARSAAQSMLPPFIDTACERLEFVVRCMFDIVVERNQKDSQSKNIEDMGVYSPFLSAPCYTYYRFVDELSNECKKAGHFYIDSVISHYSHIFSQDMPPDHDDDFICGTQKDNTDEVVITGHENIQSISRDIHERSDVYFAKILEEVMKRTVPVLKSRFLEPCRDKVTVELKTELFCMEDKKFINMFAARGYLDTIQNECWSLLQHQKRLLSFFSRTTQESCVVISLRENKRNTIPHTHSATRTHTHPPTQALLQDKTRRPQRVLTHCGQRPSKELLKLGGSSHAP